MVLESATYILCPCLVRLVSHIKSSTHNFFPESSHSPSLSSSAHASPITHKDPLNRKADFKDPWLALPGWCTFPRRTWPCSACKSPPLVRHRDLKFFPNLSLDSQARHTNHANQPIIFILNHVRTDVWLWSGKQFISIQSEWGTSTAP